MIEAINLNDPVMHVCEKDSDDVTVWLFKQLSIAEETYLRKLMVQTHGNPEGFIEVAHDFLHIALQGAENFKGEFKRDHAKPDVIPGVKPWADETLSRIPRDTREDLVAFVINGYTDLSETELKN